MSAKTSRCSTASQRIPEIVVRLQRVRFGRPEPAISSRRTASATASKPFASSQRRTVIRLLYNEATGGNPKSNASPAAAVSTAISEFNCLSPGRAGPEKPSPRLTNTILQVWPFLWSSITQRIVIDWADGERILISDDVFCNATSAAIFVTILDVYCHQWHCIDIYYYYVLGKCVMILIIL